MGSKKTMKSELTPKQEKFCQLYVSEEFFAHGTESYAEAFGLDLSLPNKYNTARTQASKLLTNANILKRINELLDLTGLNAEFVDKQLLFVITQSAEMGPKVAAIREFNKLKSRITDKIEHSGSIISRIQVDIVDTNRTENPSPEGDERPQA